MATLHVEVVSPEREVWAGQAETVVAKTIDGEMGILPGHAPVLGVLVDGSVVRVKADSKWLSAMVGSGFVSVADNRVSVLAEQAEIGDEIDVEAARQALEQARAAGDGGEEAAVAIRRAEARLRAAGIEV